MAAFNWQYVSDYNIQTNFYDGFIKLCVSRGSDDKYRVFAQGNNHCTKWFPQTFDEPVDAMKYAELQLGKMLMEMQWTWARYDEGEN